jgi:hypothetical protein
VSGLGKSGLLTVMGGFEFGGWDVATGLVEAAVVEPVDPLIGGSANDTARYVLSCDDQWVLAVLDVAPSSPPDSRVDVLPRVDLCLVVQWRAPG